MSFITKRSAGLALASLFLIGAASLPVASFAQVRLDVQSAQVQRGGGHWRGGGQHHRGGHRGHGWAGLALGIGLGALILSRPWEPVVVERPTYVYADPPEPPPEYLSDARPVPQRHPDPVIYPNRGQSDERLEADRQACNRWATTQANAMADASVFHRATLACMEGRGYTVK